MKRNENAWTAMPHARGGIDAKRLTPEFERERDPLHARQLRDVDKTEAERRAAFEAMRTKGRGSEMIQRQQPAPVLKPSPSLAASPDRAAHYDALADDSRKARLQRRLAEAKAARDVLNDHQDWLNKAGRELPHIESRAQGGDVSGATRELFKLERQLNSRSAQAHNRARSISRDVPRR